MERTTRTLLDSVYDIDKENFESYIDDSLNTHITDEQWNDVADEIRGRVDNFIDGLLESLVQDFHEETGIFSND